MCHNIIKSELPDLITALLPKSLISYHTGFFGFPLTYFFWGARKVLPRGIYRTPIHPSEPIPFVPRWSHSESMMFCSYSKCISPFYSPVSTKRVFPELDGWSAFSLTGVPQILKGNSSSTCLLLQMKASLLGPKRLTPGKMPYSMHLAPFTLRLDDRELLTGPSGQKQTSHSTCSRSFPNSIDSPPPTSPTPSPTSHSLAHGPPLQHPSFCSLNSQSSSLPWILHIPCHLPGNPSQDSLVASERPLCLLGLNEHLTHLAAPQSLSNLTLRSIFSSL